MARLDTSKHDSQRIPTSSPAQLVLPPPPFLPDEVTLPRAAPLPLELAPMLVSPDGRRTPITVAPTARDVEPSPPQRRIGELTLAAALAFGVAWLARGGLASEPADAAAPPVAALATPPLAPAAAPTPPCPLPPTATARESVANSHIPLVSVSELPLLRATTTRGASAERLRKRRYPNPSSGNAPNRSELGSVLGQVSRSAESCGERNGPVRVVVTFGNSGAARSVQVSGPGVPSTTRSCIASTAARARVPAFQGEPITVSKTL